MVKKVSQTFGNLNNNKTYLIQDEFLFVKHITICIDKIYNIAISSKVQHGTTYT